MELGIQLGTLLPSQEWSGSIGHQGTFEALPREPRQTHDPPVNPGIRDFAQVQDPPFNGDLDAKPLSAEDADILRELWQALEADKIDLWSRCRERWFDITLDTDDICRHCRNKDKKRRADQPLFFSAANHLDFGPGPAELGLPTSAYPEYCRGDVYC